MTFDLRLDSVYRHPSRDIDGHLGGCLCVYTPLEGVDAIDAPMAGIEDVPRRLRGRVGPLPHNLQLLHDLRRSPWPAPVGCWRPPLYECGVVPAPARRLPGRERQPGRCDPPDQPGRLVPGQGQVHLGAAMTLGNEFARAFMSAGNKLHAERKRRERNRAQVQRYRSRAESEPSLRYAVFSVLPEAMTQMSGNGAYTVPTRTLYYRVRPLVQDRAAIVITSPSGMPRSLDATRTGVVRDTATALGRGNRRNTSSIAPHPERREISPRLGQASAFNTEPR